MHNLLSLSFFLVIERFKGLLRLDSRRRLIDQIVETGWGNSLTLATLAMSTTVNALSTCLIVLRIFEVFREVIEASYLSNGLSHNLQNQTSILKGFKGSHIINQETTSSSILSAWDLALQIPHEYLYDSTLRFKLVVGSLLTSFRRRRHILFGNAFAATQGLCAGSHSVSLSNHHLAS